MIYFGSDWHIGHKAILSFCPRPFQSLEDMENSLLTELTVKVKPGDDVYLLGDIVFSDPGNFLDKLMYLPGNYHLIKGNHDHKKTTRHPLWESVRDYHELKHPETDHKIVLCHFPIESWNKSRYGSLHFHGHTHNNASHEIRPIENRWDVGYDATSRFINTLDEVVTKYKLHTFNWEEIYV
jgi:calcineurin-like phosphoesterase family protein